MADKFYLIRHGETVANAGGYAAGHLDTPLTEKGRAQANAARLVLEKLPVKPALIIHSHLSRAIETAKILNTNLHLPMEENDAIAEQFYGDWQGQSWNTVSESLHGDISPPNGEANADFVKRVSEGFAKIASLSDPVLVVTHGGVIKVLAREYGIDMEYVTNCAICEVIPSKKQVNILS